MAAERTTIPPRARNGAPTWDIARLYPAQGDWSEEEYLDLPGNHLVEFTDGFIEVLPMPTTSHQRLVAYIFGLLSAFVAGRNLGEALFAPLPVRLRSGKYREPDIVFMRKSHARQVREKFWDRADLLVEVISPDPKSRRRDRVKKRREYARAKIREYWIVDPQKETITVLKLSGEEYTVHGIFMKGEQAASALLAGFAVDVETAFGRATRTNGARRNQRRSRH
jgi:Uma2 family endonuclease